MKKRILFISLLLLPIGSVIASPFLDTASDSTISYGKGNKASIFINAVQYGSTYILMIANNTVDRYNISFTGATLFQQIDISYDGVQKDIYGDTLRQLQIILVEDNTVLWTEYLTIHYPNYGTNLKWLIDSLIFFVASSIGVVLAVIIFRRFL